MAASNGVDDPSSHNPQGREAPVDLAPLSSNVSSPFSIVFIDPAVLSFLSVLEEVHVHGWNMSVCLCCAAVRKYQRLEVLLRSAGPSSKGLRPWLCYMNGSGESLTDGIKTQASWARASVLEKLRITTNVKSTGGLHNES